MLLLSGIDKDCMKNFKTFAALAAFAVLFLLPSCRKSLDLSDDELPTADPSTIDPKNEEDDVSNFDGTYIVSVVYSGGSATWSVTDSLGTAIAVPDSISITVSGAGVTVRNESSRTVHYILSGSSSAGFFKLYSPARQEIELDNLTLTGSNGAAINNQSDKRTYIVLTGSNTIKDGGSYSDTPADEDERAAFFSEGQICVSGSGSLSITASSADGKGGLFSDDYIRFLGGTVTVNASKGHAIRGKDAVIVSDGTWTQDGGVVIAEAYDDAVNSAKVLTVNDGYLRGTSRNNDGVDANAAININGGVVIGEGASGAECGIDSVEGTSVTVNGGYVISRGGGINSFTTSSGKAFVQTTTSSGAKVGLVSGSTQILAYQAPSSGGTTTLFCTPEMTANSSYTIYTGVSSISEQNASFPRFGVSFSGGSSGSSLTASSSAGSSGPGGGGPGGGPGGGGWGW